MKAGQTFRSAPRSASRTPGHFTQTTDTDTILDKVMVPVDFSPPSLRALDYAASLTESAGGALQMIHVVEPTPFITGLDGSVLAISDQEVAAGCEQELARLGLQYRSPELPVASHVHTGNPVHEICHAATEADTNLLVISTHGRTGLRHLLMGSVAERIVREASCPVLVLRDGQNGRQSFNDDGSVHIRKILLPTDFSPTSVDALKYAVKFAEFVGAEITLIHCITPQISFVSPEMMPVDTSAITESLHAVALERLADIAHEHLHREVDGGFEVVIGPPLAEIPEFATVGCFDLVLCATHGYTGLKRAVLGSTAEALVRYSPCPVLVFRGQAPEEQTQSPGGRA